MPEILIPMKYNIPWYATRNRETNKIMGTSKLRWRLSRLTHQFLFQSRHFPMPPKADLNKSGCEWTLLSWIFSYDDTYRIRGAERVPYLVRNLWASQQLISASRVLTAIQVWVIMHSYAWYVLFCSIYIHIAHHLESVQARVCTVLWSL